MLNTIVAHLRSLKIIFNDQAKVVIFLLKNIDQNINEEKWNHNFRRTIFMWSKWTKSPSNRRKGPGIFKQPSLALHICICIADMTWHLSAPFSWHTSVAKIKWCFATPLTTERGWMRSKSREAELKARSQHTRSCSISARCDHEQKHLKNMWLQPVVTYTELCLTALFRRVMYNHADIIPWFSPISGPDCPHSHTLWLAGVETLLMRINVYGKEPRNPATAHAVQCSGLWMFTWCVTSHAQLRLW